MEEVKRKVMNEEQLSFEELENISGGKTTYEDGLRCEHQSVEGGYYSIISGRRSPIRYVKFQCKFCNRDVYAIQNKATGDMKFIPELEYRHTLGV
jgi:hypothetical protein